MNPSPTTGNTTPQLGFEFSSLGSTPVGVNKCGSTSISDLDLPRTTDFEVGDALSRMIVDDRVLHMGITNWRELLDRAISLGHTELYPSEDGRQGLRTPGFRFGPIHRLPEQGPEYVLQTVNRQRMQAALASGVPLKSGRVAVDDLMKVGLVITGDGMQLGLFNGRKSVGTLPLAFDAIPLPGHCGAGGRGFVGSSLMTMLSNAFPETDAPLMHRATVAAYAQILKGLGGGGAK
ncbi:TPA: hypothetical protein QDZ28_000746 [Pseudomonas putida]|nr:hypothetical protein [Pseudomonas putida]